jgi:hypothetical protein
LLSGAGIPNYPTEDDAVRGFMHLVRHREVVEALAQVPPAMPSEFAPDTDAARKIVTAALADGRQWLDPVEIKRLLEAYEIPMVPTFAATDAEQAVARASETIQKGTPNDAAISRNTSAPIFRSMPRRWGSWSRSGRISLNPDLIRAPTACIDYVITHELIHLIHPHHGPAFYELLETLMPDWRSRKQRLERTLS